MDEILDFIKEHKLVKRGDVVGVGVSGGVDSMCLLHYLNSVKEQLDIEVVGIHINHGIREESFDEAIIDPSYINDKYKFMDEVRRERAVELAFEGFRFCDLQRWLLLTEDPYNKKTSQEFARVETDDWYTNPNNDPREARVTGWREEVILTRDFAVKHYWFPFKLDDTYISIDFEQNPGW